jgi:hypothetical protein
VNWQKFKAASLAIGILICGSCSAQAQTISYSSLINGLLSGVGGTGYDNQLSRQPSSLNGLFSGQLGQLFKSVSATTNGGYSQAASYLGFDPSKLLSSGVSGQTLSNAGLAVPDDLADQVSADIESRFGKFVSKDVIGPALMRDAERRSQIAAMYQDGTDADGNTVHGLLTEAGAQDRQTALADLNSAATNLQTSLDSTVSTISSSQIVTDSNFQKGIDNAGELEGINSGNLESVNGFIPTLKTANDCAQAAASTQIAIKCEATALLAQGQLNAAGFKGLLDADLNHSKTMSGLLTAMSSQNDGMVASSIASLQTQAIMSKTLTEILKAQTSQAEDAALSRKAILDLGTSMDEQRKLDAYSQGMLTQGGVTTTGLVGVQYSSPFSKPE